MTAFEDIYSEKLDNKAIGVFSARGPSAEIYMYELPIPNSSITLSVHIDDIGNIMIAHEKRNLIVTALNYNEDEGESQIYLNARIR